MYGWLSQNPDGSVDVSFLTWNLRIDPLTVPSTTLQPRMKAIVKLLSGDSGRLKSDTTDLRNDAYNRMTGAAKYYENDEDAAFGALLAVQFFTQHPDDYKKVFTALEEQVDREFGTKLTADVNKQAFNLVTALKAVAFLIHDESRPRIINAEGTRLRMSTLPMTGDLAVAGHGLHRWGVALLKLRERTTKFSPQVEMAVWSMGWIAITSSPDAELLKTCEHIVALLDANHDNVFTTLAVSYSEIDKALGYKLPDQYRYAFVRLALAQAAAQPDVAPVAIAYQALTKINAERNDSRLRQACATFDAVEDGLDLGTRMDASRLVLKQAKAAAARRDEARMEQYVSAINQLADKAALRSPSADEIARWSVPQLARWIEGPLTGPHRGRLDPERIARSAAGRPVQPAPEPSTEKPAADHTEAELPGFGLTESNVGDVARIGLGTAAQYMNGELVLAIGQAKRLGADAKALQDCAAAAAKVQALIAQLEQHTGPFDADPVQSELSDAEACLERLRATIRAARFDAQRRSRFDDALRRALSLEPLEPGRCEGGRIACALNSGDLDWVYEAYHRRVLTDRHYVTERGRPVRLTPDTVLTLYVTQSSQTEGMVFNISVHLCKRIQGSTAPACLAGAPTDAFPPLNRGDWYDPWNTCAVLHVPSESGAAKK